MTFLTVLLVLGSLARITVLVLRPRAARRFRQPRRRLLALRLEQLGDLLVLLGACSMVLFGYGHHPSGAWVVLWSVLLVAGFSSVLMAHAVARNHRAAGPPRRRRLDPEEERFERSRRLPTR